MKTHRTLFILSLFIATPAIAASPKGASWVAELGSGSGDVEFLAIGRPSALKIHGKGEAPKGRVTVTGSQVSGEITFKLDSLDSGIGMRDKHMKEKYLETAKYPDATLKIGKLETPQSLPSGDFQLTEVPFEGPLTLHGKTHPVTGKVNLSRAGGKVRVDANFGLKITDFGIELPTFAGVTVADQVNVDVHAEAAVE